MVTKFFIERGVTIRQLASHHSTLGEIEQQPRLLPMYQNFNSILLNQVQMKLSMKTLQSYICYSTSKNLKLDYNRSST